MRRDTVKYIALLFCLTLVIPFLSGCNDTDDVQKIFTGKTWKMTYITKKNEHSWYKFTDVSEAIYKSYDPINGTKAFKIAFTGSTEDNIIRGEFSGSGSVTFTGTWQADGKSNEFRITGIKNQPSYGASKDTLAKHIVEGLENATSYEGDERNLYLYFEYEKETLCIAFTPER